MPLLQLNEDVRKKEEERKHNHSDILKIIEDVSSDKISKEEAFNKIINKIKKIND